MSLIGAVRFRPSSQGLVGISPLPQTRVLEGTVGTGVGGSVGGAEGTGVGGTLGGAVGGAVGGFEGTGVGKAVGSAVGRDVGGFVGEGTGGGVAGAQSPQDFVSEDPNSPPDAISLPSAVTVYHPLPQLQHRPSPKVSCE